MATRRPYGSEGHLAPPARYAVRPREADTPPPLEVADDALAPFGIRRGDRVVVVPRAAVEHGDVVALREDAGDPRLWKAYPERAGLRLSRGAEQRTLPPDAPVAGVVVAVLRPLGRSTH